MRANNKTLASPVNRINLLAFAAVANLASDPKATNIEYIHAQYQYLVFRSTLFLVSITYFFTTIYQKIFKTDGFEAVLDANLKKSIEKSFPGMTIDESAFDS